MMSTWMTQKVQAQRYSEWDVSISTAGDGNQLAPTMRIVKDTVETLKNNKIAGQKNSIGAELKETSSERLAAYV